MSDYLTVQEVADLARCEHKSVRRAITAGRLVAFRGPKRILVRDEDARAWIEARPIHSEETPRRLPRRPSPRASETGSVADILAIEERMVGR
jgi:excisionase family DNA binding protein